MSMQEYEHALELINRNGGGDFEGPKAESLIIKAESALSLVFPPSYRRFLLELGCGNINNFEVYGLINENFEKSTVPNGIWLTLNERRSVGLATAYIIIGEGGDGTYHVLDTNNTDSTGEVPVVRLSSNGDYQEFISSSFGEYFLKSVRSVI